MSVDVADSIEALAPEWEALAERTGAPPFLRPGYLEAWCGAFEHGPLEILVLRRGAELAGVLALHRRGATAASTANAWSEVYEPLAEDAGALRELADALFARGHRRIELLFLETTGPPAAALRDAGAAAGYRLLEQSLQRSPYVLLEGGFEEYAGTLDAKLRREVRRRRRRLEEQGELVLEVADGRERLDELLDEGLRLEAAAWKASAGTSISSSPDSERFYRALARWCAAEGTLRLGFLRLDGKPLAFDFSIEAGGAHYLMKTGYEPEARALAPGIIMRSEMIERAFAQGLRSYEFLGRDDEWKLRWTRTRREQARLRFFAPSLGGRAGWALYARAWPLAKRVLRR